MKTDKEVLDTMDDLEMIQRLHLWPGGYLCLVKRPQTRIDDYGFILKESPLVIFLGNVFNGGTGETKTYESPEEIIADGWLVD